MEFVGESGLRTGLRPVVDDWLLADEPYAVIRYLNGSPARHVLASVLRGDLAPTHEALDTVAQTFALAYLRARLVAIGVMPERDERLAALATVVRQLGPEAQGPDGKLLRQYGRWSVLRRAQLSTSGGALGFGAARYANDCIRTAVDLVDWLHGQGRRLSDLTQSHVHAGVVEHPAQRPMLRSFLLWLQARGQASDRLRLDRATSGDSRTVMDDGARVELINRCLHDATLDVRTRLAAILILVFGQPVTRIVKLTTSLVTVEEGRVWLGLGRVPLPMAPPIDRLVLAARSASVQRREQGGRGWLFPGQIPGQHLSADQLGHRLHQIGIESALTARNTAWATMATEVPAVVLAERLGFSVSAIEGWADAMGQDRGVYLEVIREQSTGAQQTMAPAGLV